MRSKSTNSIKKRRKNVITEENNEPGNLKLMWLNSKWWPYSLLLFVMMQNVTFRRVITLVAHEQNNVHKPFSLTLAVSQLFYKGDPRCVSTVTKHVEISESKYRVLKKYCTTNEIFKS